MTERSRDSRTDMPLNPPDAPIEQKQRELEGDRPRDEQAAYIDRSDTDDLGELTSTALDEGELAAGVDDDLPNDAETIEMLTELFCENLHRFLAGVSLLNVLNTQTLY